MNYMDASKSEEWFISSYCNFAYSDFAAMRIYSAPCDKVGGIRGIQWGSA